MTISQRIVQCLRTESHGPGNKDDDDESLTFDIDDHLRSSSKKVLLQRIAFVESHQSYNFNLSKLKSKYVLLNPRSKVQQGNKSTMSPALKVNAPYANEAGHDGIPAPKTVLFSAEKLELSWKKTMRAGAGLCNLGNTCFLNSSLQCLTYTAPLANYLLQIDHRKHCRMNGQFCMLCAMQQHLYNIQAHSGQAIKPMNILKNLRMIAKHLQFGRQEDAHEFIRYSVDAMQKSCLHGYPSKIDVHIKATTVIHQIFGGYLRSRVKCRQCKSVSDTYDPFLDLSLDINKQGCVDLQKCLEMFVRMEVLQGDNSYKCNNCKTTVQACKKFSIHRPPNVLMVQLKRFSNFMGSKINKELSYPSKLNIGPYMSNKPESGLWYELYAVLVHSGFSCQSGHYYTYAKASNGQWYCFNDSSVHQVSVNQALNQQAYLLFYSQSPKTSSQLGNFKHQQSVNKNLLGIPTNKQQHYKAGMTNGNRETPKNHPRPLIGPQLPPNFKSQNGQTSQSTSTDIGIPVSKQTVSCSTFSTKPSSSLNSNRSPLKFSINRKPKMISMDSPKKITAGQAEKLTNGESHLAHITKSGSFSVQYNQNKKSSYDSKKSLTLPAKLPSSQVSRSPSRKSWPSPILDKLLNNTVDPSPSTEQPSCSSQSSSVSKFNESLVKTPAVRSLVSYSSDDETDYDEEEKGSQSSYSSIGSTLKQLRQSCSNIMHAVKSEVSTKISNILTTSSDKKDAKEKDTKHSESSEDNLTSNNNNNSTSSLSVSTKNVSPNKSSLDHKTDDTSGKILPLIQEPRQDKDTTRTSPVKQSGVRNGVKSSPSQKVSMEKQKPAQREPILDLLNNEMKSVGNDSEVKPIKSPRGETREKSSPAKRAETCSSASGSNKDSKLGLADKCILQKVSQDIPSTATSKTDKKTHSGFHKNDENNHGKRHLSDKEHRRKDRERKRHFSSESSESSPVAKRKHHKKSEDANRSLSRHRSPTRNNNPESSKHPTDSSLKKRKREKSDHRHFTDGTKEKDNRKYNETSSSSNMESGSSPVRSPKKKLKHSHHEDKNNDYTYWTDRGFVKKPHSNSNGHSNGCEKDKTQDSSLESLYCGSAEYDASRRKIAKKKKQKRLINRKMLQSSINEDSQESSDFYKYNRDTEKKSSKKKTKKQNGERQKTDSSSENGIISDKQNGHRESKKKEQSNEEGEKRSKERVYKWDEKRSSSSSSRSSSSESKERPNILAQLLKQSSGKAYGTKVDTWNGDASLVEKDAQDTWKDDRAPLIDDWDREYDRGKTKKIKKKEWRERDSFSSHNIFQKFQNMKNQRNVV